MKALIARIPATIMTCLGLSFCQSRLFVAVGISAIGLLTAVPASASEVMLVNVQTNKCLTFAGGRNPDNNIPNVQFDCDADPSRRWELIDVTGSGVYQIRNVQTSKCLTFAGGRNPNNNVPNVQFDCDADPSRRWTLRLKV